MVRLINYYFVFVFVFSLLIVSGRQQKSSAAFWSSSVYHDFCLSVQEKLDCGINIVNNNTFFETQMGTLAGP